jgi:hypothetical protein
MLLDWDRTPALVALFDRPPAPFVVIDKVARRSARLELLKHLTRALVTRSERGSARLRLRRNQRSIRDPDRRGIQRHHRYTRHTEGFHATVPAAWRISMGDGQNLFRD